MRIWKPTLIVVAILSLSCEPDAVTGLRAFQGKLREMQVEVDPTCNYVSTQCAYTIDGVTITGGGNSNPPPLIIWVYFEAQDPPSILNFMLYPNDGNYGSYYGATVGTSDIYLYPGGHIVEASCDPSKPGCLLPLEPRDSVFLLTVSQYVKSDDELESQDQIDQCREMADRLQDLIGDSFNRPAGNESQGIFRGRDESGAPMSDTRKVHGGAFHGGAVHLDNRAWNSIYAADSVLQRRRLVAILLHEAAHALGKNHSSNPNVSYTGYAYFRYVIPGDRRSCVVN